MMSSLEEYKGMKTIDDLPDEILEYILSLVSPYQDAEACKAVCRRWYRAVNRVNQHAKCDLYRAILNSNVVWQCVFPSNFGPTTTIAKRYSHAACYCDKFMYVFGGCTLRCTMFNDLWALDLSSRKWIRPYCTGCYPSPKACATMCCYNKSLILFGGWTHPPPYPLHQMQRLFNELHIYDINANTWNLIHSPCSPPPMAGHSATVHGKKMIVFGGLYSGGSLFLYRSSNDVWCFNLENHNWKKAKTTDDKPKTRYGHSQIRLDDNNLLIMGGRQGPNSILDDVWVLCMKEKIWSWKQLKVNNPQWAAPHLWCHPACKVGDLVVVFSSSAPQSHYSSRTPSLAIPPPTHDPTIPPEVVARQASRNVSQLERDVNVNGQRGSLGRGWLDEAAGPVPGTSAESDNQARPAPRVRIGERITEHEPSCHLHGFRLNPEMQMAAFQNEPYSSCNCIQKNRLRQLEMLKKMEDRYKYPYQPKPGQPNDPNSGPEGFPRNRMNMYVMDISKALTEEASVTWRPPKRSWMAPRDAVFHSLVLGKGELIIFGGVQKSSPITTVPVPSYKSVSNNIHIISAPRNVV